MNKKLKEINYIKCNNKVIIIDRKNKNLISFKSGKYDLTEKNLIAIANQCKPKNVNDNGGENKLHTVYFMVTNSCNLSCPFCSAKANSEMLKELDFDYIKDNIIPKIKELKIKNIVLSGGEPLILKNIAKLTQLLKKELDINITLQTNGIIINESLVGQLKDSIDFIDFSIQYYFLKPENNFKIEKTLNLLQKITHNIGISFVIDKENKDFVYNILDLAVKYDTYISLKFIDPIGDAKDNNINILSGEERLFIYDNILDYIIKNDYYSEKLLKLFTTKISFRESCGACKNIFSIKPNGNMYVCYSLMDSNFYIDNINESTVTNIIKQFEENKFSRSIIDLFDSKNLKQCSNCKIYNICQGACAANRYYNSEKSIDCKLIKLFLGYNAFYYDKNKSIKENLICLRKCIEDKIYLNF